MVIWLVHPWKNLCWKSSGDIDIYGQTERPDFCKTYDTDHTWRWHWHARPLCACRGRWRSLRSCSLCTATRPPSSPCATWPGCPRTRSPHPRKSLLLKGLVQKWTLWESNRNCHWFKSWVFKKRGTCGRVDNLFTDAGTLIYGQTRPSGCCRTCHIVGTRVQWTGCAWPRCAGRGWCASSPPGRWSTASQTPPTSTSWKRLLLRRALGCMREKVWEEITNNAITNPIQKLPQQGKEDFRHSFISALNVPHWYGVL